jgi:hypothetical protein
MTSSKSLRAFNEFFQGLCVPFLKLDALQGENHRFSSVHRLSRRADLNQGFPSLNYPGGFVFLLSLLSAFFIFCTPYSALNEAINSVISVTGFSPVTSSAHIHSTSELLRTLLMSGCF